MKKALLIYKKSKYDIQRNSPDKYIRDYAESDDETAVASREQHKIHKDSLERVISDLDKSDFDYQTIYRADFDKSKVDDHNLVIAFGGDGTFFNVAHYIYDRPLLGVNPGTSVGFYCHANSDDFHEVINSIDEQPITKVHRLELELNGKIIPEQVLNDILIADNNPAAYTYYSVEDHGDVNIKRSNGLLVATAAGSTAWIRNLRGAVLPLESPLIQYHHRDVNSPFFITDGLKVKSYSRQADIYVDGDHLMYPFNLESELVIRNGKPLHIIGEFTEKRRKYFD
ncbi:MAG: NAD(+)/NADH kinase [archaeon]